VRAKIEQLKKKGQGLVEYALILVLIAIVVILILSFLGTQVNTTFSRISSGLNP
jgi:pilus assembly protein Flp/PilA